MLTVVVKEIIGKGAAKRHDLRYAEAEVPRVRVAELREEVARRGAVAAESVKLLLGGCLLHDSQLLCDLPSGSSSSLLELHAVLARPELLQGSPLAASYSPSASAGAPSFPREQSSPLSFPTASRALPILDAQSERAALTFMSQQAQLSQSLSSLSPERHAHLACALATLSSGSPNFAVPRDGAAAPPLQRAGGGPPGAGLAGEQGLRLFDPALIARLTVGFFLLTNGASATRTALFFVGGLFYYLFEVGFVALVLKRFLERNRARRQAPRAGNALPARGNLQAGAGAGAAGDAGAAAAAAADADEEPFMRHALLALLTTGLRVPTAPGLFFDLWALVLGLVCSLFPSWQVETFPEPPPPAAPAGPGPAAPAGPAGPAAPEVPVI